MATYASAMTQGGGGETGRVRASDQERDAVAAVLSEHVAVGRLSPQEHEQRLAELYASRFRDELALVMRELPPSSPPAVRRTGRWLYGRSHRAASALVASATFSSVAWWWSVQGGGNKELFGLGSAAPLPVAAVTWVALFTASEAAGRLLRDRRRLHNVR